MTSSLAFIALAIGLFYGWTLHRIGATKAENLIQMMRGKDLTIPKYFLLAAATTLVALAIIGNGITTVGLSTAGVLATIVGGAVFGIGLTITGYTPATALCGIGEGKKDALFTTIGAIAGVLVFAAIYSVVTPIVTAFPMAGVTWALVLGTSATALSLLLGVTFGIWAINLDETKATASVTKVTKTKKAANKSSR